ncbi:MAG: flagellar export chaperone FliS [candidate division Zixibacteria bacterium]
MDDNLTAYKQADILGKSQLDLVIQVYDGAIGAYRTARKAYEDEKPSLGYEHLQKARRFVTHLYTTLDMEKGGNIADQLSRLYAFLINQTNVIEATKDLKQIDDNISILDNLRSGWVGLKEQQREEKAEKPQSDRPEKSLATTA